MEAAVRFYTDVLGFALKFRDGDHWAAFDVGGSTLAVEGGAPGGPGGATVSLRVEGFDALVSDLRSQGGQGERCQDWSPRAARGPAGSGG